MRVETLDPKKHNRKEFDCGRAELNEWFATQAGQVQRSHHSARTFVLTDDGETVIGYYSLASHSVDIDRVNPMLAKGQSRDFPIPSVILARLAVDVAHQGNRLGERLLADAIRRAIAAAESVGIALFVVDALDDEAAEFYEQYGLERWPADSLRLFARLRDLSATMTNSGSLSGS